MNKKSTILNLLLCIIIANLSLVNVFAFQIQIKLTKVGSLNTNGDAVSTEILGDIAFVLTNSDSTPDGVVIVNITDPTNPQKISSFYDGGKYYQIKIKNNLAFLADGSDGLEILNITNLLSPVKVNNYPVSYIATDVEIIGDILYLASWSQGLLILNISNPENLQLINQYNDNSLCCIQIEINGNIACITDHKSDYTSLRFLDISTPISPILISSLIKSQTDFWSPKIIDNILAVANHYANAGEMRIYNISNLQSIQEIAIYDQRSNIMAITPNGTTLLLADYKNGLEIIDITQPENPIKIGDFYDGSHSQDVTFSNGLIFASNLDAGLEVFSSSVLTKEGNISGVVFSFVWILLFTRTINRKKRR
ncbi:MAG: LVIVD repeat-containing protein [Candidatus Thorarchaeota archaeon]